MSKKDKKQGFGFGLEKIREFQEALNWALEIRSRAKDIQDRLKKTCITANHPQCIKIIFSGVQEPVSCKINSQILTEKSLEKIQQLLVDTMLDAYLIGADLLEKELEETLQKLPSSLFDSQKYNESLKPFDKLQHKIKNHVFTSQIKIEYPCSKEKANPNLKLKLQTLKKLR